MINSEDIKFIPEALSNLKPGAKWFVKDTEIQWLDENVKRPTDDEIKAEINRLKIVKEKEKQRQEAKAKKDKALQNNTYTLSDGSVYQVRPQDFSNFQAAIQLGTDTDWILADNTVRHTTIDELKEILKNGIKQAKAIYDEYIDELKNIEEDNG